MSTGFFYRLGAKVDDWIARAVAWLHEVCNWDDDEGREDDDGRAA